ncbi:MAG TPA: hypothetical protein VH373_00980 [Jatrophihabitantaceae bacterium]|jgi:hypothetical protein
MTNIDTEHLVRQYVAVWTEPDPAARRTAIEQLWTEDGAHVLHPPAEIREAATTLGFVRPTLEARGYDELEARVTRAYDAFVAPGEYTFRTSGPAVRLHDIVTFRWEMAPAGGGAAVGGGLDVFVLDGGRVRTDYQFPDL